MKKIIFADVDGTIYNKEKIILPELKQDIEFASSKNFGFIIATGNPVFSQMKWLSKELNVRYIVGSNGAAIYDFKAKKYLFKSKIDKNSINKIALIAKKLSLFFDYWNEDYIFVTDTNNYDQLNSLRNTTTHKSFNKSQSVIKKINYKTFFDGFKAEVYGEKKLINKFFNIVKNNNIDLQLVFMSNTHIEITKKNINKASGIKWLIQHLNGAPIDLCMTIGDSGNDETMLKASSFSYAMGNAPLHIKKISKYVTDNVENNGLGKAIREYIKRNEK